MTIFPTLTLASSHFQPCGSGALSCECSGCGHIKEKLQSDEESTKHWWKYCSVAECGMDASFYIRKIILNVHRFNKNRIIKGIVQYVQKVNCTKLHFNIYKRVISGCVLALDSSEKTSWDWQFLVQVKKCSMYISPIKWQIDTFNHATMINW